jgi:hypothetical protein
MLRVNVGLSRKLSKDFNSTGFTLNLDGEINAPMDDPETVIERIREFYDLADEALQDQITRHQEIETVAAREAAAIQNESVSSNSQNGDQDRRSERRPRQDGDNKQNGNRNGEPATNKQVQFLLNIGKRQGFSKPQLENRIAGILGHSCGVYDLTKKDAGVVLDTLTDNGNGR